MKCAECNGYTAEKYSFHCDGCKSPKCEKCANPTASEKIIESEEKIIQLLENQILKLGEDDQEIRANTEYNAEKGKSFLSKPVNNVLSVIIKSKGKQERKIDEENYERTVLVRCSTIRSMKNMQKEDKKSMGSQYTIEQTKLRKPCVTIANIGEDTSADDISIGLTTQMKIWKMKRNVLSKYLKNLKIGDSIYAVGECNGALYRKI
ncbi:hypothetical protein WA026_012753 [Henosepilachna vigintioctopunctata]|uniref:Uncharacterized protein n=1 Tax=Henosepilachna vigintioctopunctata TaxID=420089 RepID=A0AAW1U8Q2_9CUCU